MTASADQSEPASCTIEAIVKPEWSQWKNALASHRPSPARQQLGIPNDRPIVMSGHQPTVFHNGILAKLITQYEAARLTGAGRVWIVPDQDLVDLETIRVPVGSGNNLTSREVQILEPGSVPSGVPAASLPAMNPLDPDDDRLAELVEYLRGYSHESTLARQFASATIQLTSDRLGIVPPQMIYASDLLKSDSIWDLIHHKMYLEPEESVCAYNRASLEFPEARIRPLEIKGDDCELPLWRLRDGYSRIAINDANFEQNKIAPRALLMSGIARAYLCELFIHGTGGWVYDQITEGWFRDWLDIELAPMAMTTATQRLDLGFDSSQVVSVDEASWAYHHARHTPAMLGNEETQERKDHLVEQISALKHAGENPDHAYQKLVMLLEDYRVQSQTKLDELKGRISHARASRKQIELANDRTWPFVLFNDEQLEALRDAVVAALV